MATYEASTNTLKYVLADAQGSTRAIMNNNGGSSSVIARHDYLPFGGEIGSGIGPRSGGQGYGATDTNRRKYGLIERDDLTGLDHTWWRKYDNSSGRFTSPDPLTGSLANPQSFNRYSYALNDPVNLVDPSGLSSWSALYVHNPDGTIKLIGLHWDTSCNVNSLPREGGVTGGGGGGGGSLFDGMFLTEVGAGIEGPGNAGGAGLQNLTHPNNQQKAFNDCVGRAVWQWRKAHAKDTLRGIGGGILIVGGGYVAIRGIPGTGPGGGIGLNAAVKAALSSQGMEVPPHLGYLGLSAGLPLVLLGSMMVAKAFKETHKNFYIMQAALYSCKEQFPNADHSLAFFKNSF